MFSSLVRASLGRPRGSTSLKRQAFDQIGRRPLKRISGRGFRRYSRGPPKRFRGNPPGRRIYFCKADIRCAFVQAIVGQRLALSRALLIPPLMFERAFFHDSPPYIGFAQLSRNTAIWGKGACAAWPVFSHAMFGRCGRRLSNLGHRPDRGVQDRFW